MINVFFAEFRKLHRPTLVLSTFAAVIGIEALFTSLLFLLINSKNGNSREGRSVSSLTLSLPSGLVYAFTTTATLLGVVALCIFAAQTAQEYTFGTLRNLLVRQPSRMKILGGKYLSMALFALVMDILALTVSVGISFGLAKHAHVSTSLWATTNGFHILAESFGNVFLSSMAYGTFGMILGLLLRSPISSVAIGSIWVIIIEGLLGLVVKHLDHWLPGSLFGAVGAGGIPGMVTYKHALLYGGLYLLVGGAIVSVLFKRRDVAN